MNENPKREKEGNMKRPLYLVTTKIFPDGRTAVEIQKTDTKPEKGFQSLPDMDVYFDYYTSKNVALKKAGENLDID